MANQNILKLGDWNAICDVCRFKKKASELKRRWDGLIVCEQDWETRHISDFIKSPPPEPALPWTKPEPAYQYVSVTYNESAGTQQLTTPSGTFNSETL